MQLIHPDTVLGPLKSLLGGNYGFSFEEGVGGIVITASSKSITITQNVTAKELGFDYLIIKRNALYGGKYKTPRDFLYFEILKIYPWDKMCFVNVCGIVQVWAEYYGISVNVPLGKGFELVDCQRVKYAKES